MVADPDGWRPVSSNMGDGIKTDLVIRAVSGRLECAAETLRIRPVQTGKFNSTFAVDGWSSPLIVRIAPPEDRSRMLFYEHRMILQEPEILKAVRQKTSIPVPHVLSMVERDPELGRDWMIMARLPGAPMTGTVLAPEGMARAMRETGQHLSKIHQLRGEMFGYHGEHRPMEPSDSWPEAFTTMWNSLIDDIERCGGYSAEESHSMRRLVESFRAELPEIEFPSLLHMDIWHENILVAPDGKVTGIIDWDRALWGDPMLDLAICHYCGITTPEFAEGYGRELKASAFATPLAKLYLLYEIQKYIVINLVRRGDRNAADNFRIRSFRMAHTLFR
jgi:aminoglycoside phosphotransferase (APT) family kinase protein